VLEDLLGSFISKESTTQTILLDYGLHETPEVLRDEVQTAIGSVEEPSLVVLGYGLCGNGLDGIEAGIHTLLIPRVDDCIALLLGSYEAYLHEFKAVPGTYYLSKGWLEAEAHPLAEYTEYVEKYGPAKAALIMDSEYQHYERLMLVAHDQADLDEYRSLAQEVAHFCERWDMRYEEKVGSDEYVRRLIETARGLVKANEDFLVIPPGAAIQQDQFFR
jgi:hypothetical protein